MGKGQCTYRQRDLQIGLKAMLMAGIEVERVEIGKDGKIVIVGGKPGKPSELVNPWDRAIDELRQ
jgi:hypothetical protein